MKGSANLGHKGARGSEEVPSYLRTFRVTALTSRDAHSLDITCFTILTQSEDRGLLSPRSCGELARARAFVQPWLTVSLVLTDDKLRAWDKLGIGYAAHVSFRGCPFAVIPPLICCLAGFELLISV